MLLVATVINFLTKISLENYATTQLGQKKSIFQHSHSLQVSLFLSLWFNTV